MPRQVYPPLSLREGRVRIATLRGFRTMTDFLRVIRQLPRRCTPQCRIFLIAIPAKFCIIKVKRTDSMLADQKTTERGIEHEKDTSFDPCSGALLWRNLYVPISGSPCGIFEAAGIANADLAEITKGERTDRFVLLLLFSIGFPLGG